MESLVFLNKTLLFPSWTETGSLSIWITRLYHSALIITPRISLTTMISQLLSLEPTNPVKFNCSHCSWLASWLNRIQASETNSQPPNLATFVSSSLHLLLQPLHGVIKIVIISNNYHLLYIFLTNYGCWVPSKSHDS